MVDNFICTVIYVPEKRRVIDEEVQLREYELYEDGAINEND